MGGLNGKQATRNSRSRQGSTRTQVIMQSFSRSGNSLTKGDNRRLSRRRKRDDKEKW